MDWSGLGDLAFSVSSLLAVAELQSCGYSNQVARHGRVHETHIGAMQALNKATKLPWEDSGVLGIHFGPLRMEK